MSKIIYPGQEGGPAAVFKQPLQRPIPNADAEMISEITFREPRAGDIMRLGNPVKVNLQVEPIEISFDDAKMGPMLCALSSIPPDMLGRMHPQDYIACCWGIAGFFMPAGLMQ